MYFIKFDDETLKEAIEAHANPEGFATFDEALEEAKFLDELPFTIINKEGKVYKRNNDS